MQQYFEEVNNSYGLYQNDLNGYNSYFEYSENESEESFLNKLDNFLDQNLSLFQSGLNLMEKLKEMIKKLEDDNSIVLQKCIEANVIGIYKLQEKRSNNPEIINKLSELDSRKRDIEMKQKKLLMERTQIEQYENIIRKMDGFENKINQIDGKLTNIDNKTNTVQTTANSITDKIDTKTNEIKSKINSVQTTANNLPSKIDSKCDEITKTLTSISTIQKSISSHPKMTEIIDQVENWTSKKTSKILFDSDIHDWNINTSVFGDKVSGYNKVMILIETTSGVIFGQYIPSIVDDELYQESDGTWSGSGTYDSSSFVFSNKSGVLKKYETKSGKSSSLDIWPKSHKQLFNIGYNCVYIYKKRYASRSNFIQNNDNTYNFNGESNALLGPSENNKFTPKRILVYQLQ